MEDYIYACTNCMNLITDAEDELFDGLCTDCYDEDDAERSFLDELIDFGGEG